jgi:hypothetical protein
MIFWVLGHGFADRGAIDVTAINGGDRSADHHIWLGLIRVSRVSTRIAALEALIV